MAENGANNKACRLLVILTPLVYLLRLIYLLFYLVARICGYASYAFVWVLLQAIWRWLMSSASNHDEQTDVAVQTVCGNLNCQQFAPFNNSTCLLSEEMFARNGHLFGDILQKQRDHHQRAFELISKALKLDEQNSGNLTIMLIMPPT